MNHKKDLSAFISYTTIKFLAFCFRDLSLLYSFMNYTLFEVNIATKGFCN